MHEELEDFDPDRFPMPGRPCATSFRAAFRKGRARVSIIVDEADNLTNLPRKAQSEFLLELRACKQMARGTLGGIILVGTWNLKKLLAARNWNTENAESPFSLVILKSPH